MCSPNFFRINTTLLWSNKLYFKGIKPGKDNIMKNLIIYVQGVLLGLFIGFTGACAVVAVSQQIENQTEDNKE